MMILMATLTPDTVSEAVELLRGLGYVEDFEVQRSGVACSSFPDLHPLDQVNVDHTFRFEGDTDPADEAIVLGLSAPKWGTKGIVVSGFGPTTDPKTAELLRGLAG